MKCPYCDRKIGLFSKALNKFDKVKHCPHCSEPIKLFLDFKVAAMLLIPLVLLSVLFLKPIVIALGLSGSVATGLMTGLILILSMRLKKLT